MNNACKFIDFKPTAIMALEVIYILFIKKDGNNSVLIYMIHWRIKFDGVPANMHNFRCSTDEAHSDLLHIYSNVSFRARKVLRT